MNFGDILDKWEQDPHSSKNSAVLKYDSGAKTPTPGKNRRRLLREKPDDILDLHGFTEEKAWLALDAFFNKANACGFKKLRVIHGKGNHTQGEAVLMRTVRGFIEQCPFAGESGFEKAAYGGSGATWVLLK